MPVLVVVDIKIINPEPYKEYIEQITPSVFAYGGCYLVRGGSPTSLDGDWNCERMVIMQYPDRATAEAWLNDPKLAHIHNMRRDNSSQCNMQLVDMVETADGR